MYSVKTHRKLVEIFECRPFWYMKNCDVIYAKTRMTLTLTNSLNCLDKGNCAKLNNYMEGSGGATIN